MPKNRNFDLFFHSECTRFLSWQDKRVLYKGKTITMKFCGRGMLEALATFRKSIVLENTVLLAIGCCFFRIWNLECIDTVYLAFFCVLPKFHTLSWSSGLVLLRVNAFNSHARIISKVKSGRILHSSGTERGKVTPGQKTPKTLTQLD